MAVGDYGFSISVAGLNAASVVGLDGRVVGVGVERSRSYVQSGAAEVAEQLAGASVPRWSRPDPFALHRMASTAINRLFPHSEARSWEREFESISRRMGNSRKTAIFWRVPDPTLTITLTIYPRGETTPFPRHKNGSALSRH